MSYNSLLSFVTQSCTQTLHEVSLYHLNSICTTVQYICQTPIVVDIQTQSRHGYRVMWVDIVILQYLYCHDDDSNIFSDMTQFSVLQEAWVTCLLFILIFQSISRRNIMLSSCSPVQIYILLLCQRTSTFPKDVSCKVL